MKDFLFGNMRSIDRYRKPILVDIAKRQYNEFVKRSWSKVHFVELKLCEKVGKVLEECNKIYHKNSLKLLLAWLESETFAAIVDGDVALCSQAKTYVIRAFMDETKEELAVASTDKILSNEAMFWFGYLSMYWCLEYKENGKSILADYDIESIIYSYEVLHSLSVKMAIEKIREDYRCG